VAGEKKAREVEFEVLGREPRKPATPGDAFIALVARLMDEVFVIPGTKIRFGFDPLIGLLPGFGAWASAAVSLALIALSARRRLPRVVLARMAVNVLINAGLDLIPVVGDALSIFYRSNAKNYALLQKHAGTAPASTRGDWIFLGVLIGGLLLCIALLGFAAIYILVKIFRALG
jgi:hypothetical protein